MRWNRRSTRTQHWIVIPGVTSWCTCIAMRLLYLVVAAVTIASDGAAAAFVPSGVSLRAPPPRTTFLLSTTASPEKLQQQKIPLPLLDPTTVTKTSKDSTRAKRLEKGSDEKLLLGVSREDENVDDQLLLDNKMTPLSPFGALSSLASSARGRIQKIWEKIRSFKPSVQFRLQLGLGAMTALAVVSRWIPQARVLAAVSRWLSHRGFQGLSALGRSVAYGWALLVAYPRMLDRRAKDLQRRDRERAQDRRQQRLRSLAAEVARLRQELLALDKEIRTFRREVLLLKANEGAVKDEVQEAIATELAHLAQLRADTQASLTAVRQTWAELRAKSSPELWEDSIESIN